MSEYKNRLTLQRQILKVVNISKLSTKEKLFGLSKNAIERWYQTNLCDKIIYEKLILTSSKLFFLATKSQEQITEDYKKLSDNVTYMIADLKSEVKRSISVVEA